LKSFEHQLLCYPTFPREEKVKTILASRVVGIKATPIVLAMDGVPQF